MYTNEPNGDGYEFQRVETKCQGDNRSFADDHPYYFLELGNFCNRIIVFNVIELFVKLQNMPAASLSSSVYSRSINRTRKSVPSTLRSSTSKSQSQESTSNRKPLSEMISSTSGETSISLNTHYSELNDDEKENFNSITKISEIESVQDISNFPFEDGNPLALGNILVNRRDSLGSFDPKDDLDENGDVPVYDYSDSSLKFVGYSKSDRYDVQVVTANPVSDVDLNSGLLKKFSKIQIQQYCYTSSGLKRAKLEKIVDRSSRYIQGGSGNTSNDSKSWSLLTWISIGIIAIVIGIVAVLGLSSVRNYLDSYPSDNKPSGYQNNRSQIRRYSSSR